MRSLKQPTHTIKDGYCTVCSETEEWLLSRGIPCNYVIPAREVQAGDYLHTTSNGGMRHATIAIGAVSTTADGVALHAAQTTHYLPADAIVTVSRG